MCYYFFIFGKVVQTRLSESSILHEFVRKKWCDTYKYGNQTSIKIFVFFYVFNLELDTFLLGKVARKCIQYGFYRIFAAS